MSLEAIEWQLTEDWLELSSFAHEMALFLARDLDSAEDIAQEVLLSLVRRREPPASPRAWIVGGLRRQVVRRRLEKARRHAREERGPEPGAPAPSGPEETIDLRRAFALLSLRQARLLRAYLTGHSHAEIAAVVGCKVHQVGPRVQRALCALGRLLGYPNPPTRAPRV
jgi:RNA polymerase sigma factor (sigma-70 family)